MRVSGEFVNLCGSEEEDSQALNIEEGAYFLSHIFDLFLTGSTPSTAGVHPTGKKKD